MLGDDYPLLFPSGDGDALAERLLSAFTDEEARAAALAAIERRRAELSDGSAIAGYEEALRVAAARVRAGGRRSAACRESRT